MNNHRSTKLREGKQGKGPVVYWMSREQRVNDNWALLYSLTIANNEKRPLAVAFSLAPSFPNANARHYHFMLSGLQEVESNLNQLGIAFHLLQGDPELTIPEFLTQTDAMLLVSDFDPLRIKQKWKGAVNGSITVGHIEVDAHNIVPCRHASQKVEFGAHTLRRKINRLLPTFLNDIPRVASPTVASRGHAVDWPQVNIWLNADSSVKPANWITPGESAAVKSMERFIQRKLNGYSSNRNNPNADAQSGLSPYLHFGQLSAQRVALGAMQSDAPDEDKADFLDELIVRRELADNFCLYNPHYDTPEGFHPWAKATHNEHSADEREYTYAPQQFEQAQTHDPLWNAAQKQMIVEGKMHGYMRMYWAKKILEWTKSPADAMRIAIYLNDKYSLDGRDPNGYAGIAWSIGGVHDRAWTERPVFGKIRYMNYNGCKRKFDVNEFIRRYP